ncbi:unnamed protein product, partial [Arabidopsis halleri]
MTARSSSVLLPSVKKVRPIRVFLNRVNKLELSTGGRITGSSSSARMGWSLAASPDRERCE